MPARHSGVGARAGRVGDLWQQRVLGRRIERAQRLEEFSIRSSDSNLIASYADGPTMIRGCLKIRSTG